MKAICPTCSTIHEMKLGYAGLINCACGVRFDAYAHIHRSELTPFSNQSFARIKTISIDAIHTEEPPVEDTQLTPTDLHQPSTPREIGKHTTMAIVVGLSAFTLIFFGILNRSEKPENLTSTTWTAPVESLVSLSPGVGRPAAEPAISAPTTNQRPPNAKESIAIDQLSADPLNLQVSNANLNAVGRNNYFLSLDLKNTSNIPARWPIIEVTLQLRGNSINQKLVTPEEYLHSDASLNLKSGETVQLKMNLVFKDGSADAEDYQVKPLYLHSN